MFKVSKLIKTILDYMGDRADNMSATYKNERREPMNKLITAALLSGLACTAYAADFPARNVSLVVPNPPGGLVDTSARIVAEPLARALGASVVVENRDGGSGNIAYQHVARSAPDGYTLLVSYSAYHVGNPNLTKNLP